MKKKLFLLVIFLNLLMLAGCIVPINRNYKNKDFTESEANMYNEYFGFVIPYLNNNEYQIEDNYENTFKVSFKTYHNTSSDFSSYNAKFKKQYSTLAEEKDDYDITWYNYTYMNSRIMLSFYSEDSIPTMHVLVFKWDSNNDEILKANGVNVSSGTGYYDLDFSSCSYSDVAKNNSCPTTGDVNALVIPVEFSDRLAANLGYKTKDIELAFNSKNSNELEYYSVSEYFYKSSYGKLNLHFDVLDSFIMANHSSTYYQNITNSTEVILDEMLVKLDSSIDYNKYDSNNDGLIDAIILVNTMDIDYNVEMKWAFMTYDLMGSVYDSTYFYKYDNVRAYTYFWCPYGFLRENEEGYNNEKINTYTIIHEFSHILGADDYYDTSYLATNTPLLNLDVMDATRGDHNPFTKFYLGFINKSKIVTTNSSVTLSLKDYGKTGDTIILANNFDEKLGIYQEYYVLMYYKNEGLNDSYFKDNGIVMYHINASLRKYGDFGHTSYKIMNNNTSKYSVDGSYNNLVELVLNSKNKLYQAGDILDDEIYDDNDIKLKYSFEIQNMNDEEVKIKFVYKG